MKNYFESENVIIPFKSVAFVEIGRNGIDVALNKTFTATMNESYFYKFPIEQFENYKNWLDSQSNYSEIPNSSDYNEDNIKNPATNNLINAILHVIDKADSSYCNVCEHGDTIESFKNYCEKCGGTNLFSLDLNLLKEIISILEEK